MFAIAVKVQLNRQKGDGGPDEWKPPRQEYWCKHASAWLNIKKRWNLVLTVDEAGAIAEMMWTCP